MSIVFSDNAADAYLQQNQDQQLQYRLWEIQNGNHIDAFKNLFRESARPLFAFCHGLTPQAWLMEAPALLARQP
jgi:hypothetical protein